MTTIDDVIEVTRDGPRPEIRQNQLLEVEIRLFAHVCDFLPTNGSIYTRDG